MKWNLLIEKFCFSLKCQIILMHEDTTFLCLYTIIMLCCCVLADSLLKNLQIITWWLRRQTTWNERDWTAKTRETGATDGFNISMPSLIWQSYSLQWGRQTYPGMYASTNRMMREKTNHLKWKGVNNKEGRQVELMHMDLTFHGLAESGNSAACIGVGQGGMSHNAPCN